MHEPLRYGVNDLLLKILMCCEKCYSFVKVRSLSSSISWFIVVLVGVSVYVGRFVV